MKQYKIGYTTGVYDMFHGDEWKGTELYNNYEKEFALYGAKIEYLSHTDGISSSLLREKLTEK